MSRVLTPRTGRYGELLFVKKYEGDNPAREVPGLYAYAAGDAVADAWVLCCLELSARLGMLVW